MTDKEIVSKRCSDLLRATQLENLSAQDLKRGLTTCPGSSGAHLFFSSELKSRIPESSLLSLWKGTPSEATVELTSRGLGVGVGG